MRKPIILGNWKMQLTLEEARKLILDIKLALTNFKREADVVVCPSSVHLATIRFLLPNFIDLGGQDLFWKDRGAYTGATSALQLYDLGCKYAILGHSERRREFYERDEDVNKKVIAALKNDLIPIICVGEKEEEKEKRETEKIITTQFEKAIVGLDREIVRKIIVAYEPVWAVGTGKPASGSDANKIAELIRKIILQKFDQRTKEEVRILYGGSVDAEIIEDFVSQKEIDGALVGNASLSVEVFVSIIKNTIKIKKGY
jgi:triosephosphate isomerase